MGFHRRNAVPVPILCQEVANPFPFVAMHDDNWLALAPEILGGAFLISVANGGGSASDSTFRELLCTNGFGSTA